MSLDCDFKLAARLQKEFEAENARKQKIKRSENQLTNFNHSSKDNLSLIDPSLEYIDPNPDIHALFLHFNNIFFWKKLLAVEVRWSPRMTSCAGICCYEGRGKLCSIRLSLPLLKLRPRKDLVETLLHEMIHAYLFVTNNNRDRDGHGPEFHKHMHRINKAAGTKITVYHTFHDEVKSYQQHWWKCQGPCKNRPPFFGMVRRAMNRAPGPNDNWWADHKASCGGSFVKVREPEGYSANKKGKGGGKTIAGKSNSKGKAVPAVTGFPGISPKASGTTPMKGSGTNGVISTPKSGIYGYFMPSQDGSKDKNQRSSTLGSLGKGGVSSRVQTVTTFGSSKSAETEQVETSKSFVPFTGKGNVLGGGVIVKSPSQRPGLASLLKKETETGIKNAPKRSGSDGGGSSHAKQPKIAPISSPWKARVPPGSSPVKKTKISPISSPWKARVPPGSSSLKQPKMSPISSPWKANVPAPGSSTMKQPKIAPTQSSWMAKVPPISSTSKDSDGPSSSQEQMVKCPVCNCAQSEATINAHLDECIANQNDSVDDDVVCLGSNHSTDKDERDSWFLECPGCRERVAEDDFDNHLNQCSRISGSVSHDSDSSDFDNEESSDSITEIPSCPICGVSLSQGSLGAHLENCLSSVYVDEDDGW